MAIQVSNAADEMMKKQVAKYRKLAEEYGIATDELLEPLDLKGVRPSASTKVEPGYEPLAEVLQDALTQASHGKGKKCHANNLPFIEQEIIKEGRTLGLGGHVFQIRKKVREAMNCADKDRAVEDVLGAIVYAAAMVILLREK